MNKQYNHIQLLSLTLVIAIPLILHFSAQHRKEQIGHSTKTFYNNESQKYQNLTSRPKNSKLSFLHSVLNEKQVKPKACSCGHHHDSSESHQQPNLNPTQSLNITNHTQQNHQPPIQNPKVSILSKPTQKTSETKTGNICQGCNQKVNKTQSYCEECKGFHGIDESYTEMAYKVNGDSNRWSCQKSDKNVYCNCPKCQAERLNEKFHKNNEYELIALNQ